MTESSLSEQLYSEIIKRNGLQANLIVSSRTMLTVDEREMFEKYLHFFGERGVTVSKLAESYHEFLNDTLREQLFFRRHKRYRYSKFEDVANSVYFNFDNMTKYMHGLAVSNYIWPNHLKLKNFFLKNLPKNLAGTYLEVGPGHGFYFIDAMRLSRYSEFVGVDISEASLSLTKSLVDSSHFGLSSDYRLILGDFLKTDFDIKADALVMGEVLEHVEEPLALLNRARNLTGPHSFIFLTTCINAPEIDHIYLFESPEAVEQLLQQGGFQVIDQLLLPYGELSLEETEKEKLPINVGYVLKCQD